MNIEKAILLMELLFMSSGCILMNVPLTINMLFEKVDAIYYKINTL